MLKRNKTIVAILTIAMGISLINTRVAFAANTWTATAGTTWASNVCTINEIKFTNTSQGSNNTVSVSGFTSMNPRVINIPSSIVVGGITYKVTSIGNKAFSGYIEVPTTDLFMYPNGLAPFNRSQWITSITIPEGVTSIGDYAFDDCVALTSIVIPNGVTSIGNWAFVSCHRLESITIPEGVTSIGDYVFYKCISLKSITIPKSATSINAEIFGGWPGTKEVWHYNEELMNTMGSRDGITFLNLNLPNKICENGENVELKGPVDSSTYTYKWYSNTVNSTVNANQISGANGSTYKVQTTESGKKYYYFTVNKGNETHRSSIAEITVNGQASNTNSSLKSVSISGTEEVGYKLKAKVKYDGVKPSLEYQWKRASKKSGDYSDISGADEDEYKLKSSDKNKYIKLVVTATIDGQTYTVEDITSKIDRDTSGDNDTISNSSDNNTSDNDSNNIISASRVATNINSISPDNGTFTDPSGKRVTGWIKSNGGRWYYLDRVGVAQTGWFKDTDNSWYYLDRTSKVMKTGWIKEGQKWYYLKPNGSLAVNTTIDGYTVNENGEWI